jgi:CheY-like chemotaxis protein
VKKEIICFVDDNDNELHRFEEEMQNYYTVIIGGTRKECIDKLKGKKPKLWVLDLYFPEKGSTTTPDQRKKMAKKFSELERQAHKFRLYLKKIRQTTDQSWDYLEECKKDNVPVVFLTRKGNLNDANRCFKKGAKKVLQKPMGQNSDYSKESFDKAFNKTFAKNLAEEFNEVISNHRWWNRHKNKIYPIVTLIWGAILSIIIKLYF